MSSTLERSYRIVFTCSGNIPKHTSQKTEEKNYAGLVMWIIVLVVSAHLRLSLLYAGCPPACLPTTFYVVPRLRTTQLSTAELSETHAISHCCLLAMIPIGSCRLVQALTRSHALSLTQVPVWPLFTRTTAIFSRSIAISHRPLQSLTDHCNLSNSTLLTYRARQALTEHCNISQITTISHI